MPLGTAPQSSFRETHRSGVITMIAFGMVLLVASMQRPTARNLIQTCSRTQRAPLHSDPVSVGDSIHCVDVLTDESGIAATIGTEDVVG